MGPIGLDTIGAFEAAASRRYTEAQRLLEAGLRLGAIYLFGYTIEMRLKVGYFRAIGFRKADEITAQDRRIAESNAIQLGLMSSAPHDVAGWAELLIFTRDKQHRGYGRAQRDELRSYIGNASTVWTPTLRYRALVPAIQDVDAVRSAADWIQTAYHSL